MQAKFNDSSINYNMAYISNNLTNPQMLTLNKLNQANSLLKVGQVLSANIDQIQGNRIQISLGNQTLVATSKENTLNTGPIQLQVKQLQPSLELVIVRSPKQTSQQQLQQLLQTTYRQVMPNQANISQIFQQITLLQALPTSLTGPINQLLEQVNKASQSLSGKDIKSAMANSGLFLESKINNKDKSGLNHDVKAQLLKLQQQTETLNIKNPSPQLGQLSSALSQAVNRITFQQLQLYENPYVTPLDLPFDSQNAINEGYIELRKYTQEQNNSWEVLLEMQLPLGELFSKLTLNQQSEINCIIWCETNDLEKLITEKLDQLKQQFKDNTLSLKQIQIVKQKPIKTDKTTQVALIDIHI